MITRERHSNDYVEKLLWWLRGEVTLMITMGGYSSENEGSVLCNDYEVGLL